MATVGSAAPRLGGPGSTRTVERALALLAEVCAEQSLSLSEAARRVQLPASTALRLLRTLESAGFVSRSADGAFHAGTRIIQIGAAVLSRQRLVALTEPALQRIVAATGESTYLAIRGAGDTALFVGMVEGTRAVRHGNWVGRAISLGELAVGRALRGERSETGYFAERDATEPDVTGIAAAIRWPGGVAGALNLVGPSYRIDEVAMRTYGEIVSREADQISATLAAEPQLLREPGTTTHQAVPS